MSEKPPYEKLEQRVQELEQAESERKEVEDTLRESESRLIEAQRLAHMGNWFWDVNSGKVEWSDEVFKIFRLNPKEFTPQIDSILDLSPWPEDHQRDKELIQKAVESHEVGSYEQRFLRPDGTTGYYFSSFQGIYDDNGKLTAINGMVQDITERKEVETGLEKTLKELEVIKIAADEAHEFADCVINTVREPLISLDQDLRVVTASRSFYDLFKVTPEETVGQLIYDLGNKQWNIPKLHELLETILPEKTTFDNYEVEHDFPIIGRRVMLLNARQIQRAMGKERIILLAIEDITERQRLENLLIDSEERFRRLFETADDGILLLEKSEGKIVNVNPSVTTILGYSKDDCIGNKLENIGVLHDMGNIDEINKTLNSEAIIHFDYVPIQTKAGKAIDAEMYCVDKASLIQCNIRDITERKQSERELNESLLQQKEIVKASNIGLWDWDLIANKVKYSAEWKAQIGYDEHEISDDFKEWETRVHPDDLMPTLEKIQNTIDKRKNHQVEFRFRHKNGSYRWILAQGSLFLDESGRPIKMRGSHIDITERKQSEQELMESKQKFQSMVENIGIGVSMISLTMEVLELNRQMSE